MLRNKYLILGLMSGTSLDGLDLAFCEFEFKYDKWTKKIIKAKTFHYKDDWKNWLGYAQNYSAPLFWKLHVDYGKYLASQCNDFI